MSICDVNDDAGQAARTFLDRVNNIIWSLTDVTLDTTKKPPKPPKHPSMVSRDKLKEAIAWKLYGHLNEMGKNFLFHPDIPTAFVHGIQRMFQEDNGYMLNDNVVNNIERKSLTMIYNKISKTIDSDSRLSKFDIEWMPVLRTMIKKDKSGLLHQYIENTMSVSDDAYSNHVPFTLDFSSALTKHALQVKKIASEMSFEDVIVGDEINNGIQDVYDNISNSLVTVLSVAKEATIVKGRIIEKAAYNVLDNVTLKRRIIREDDLSINSKEKFITATDVTYKKIASEALSGRIRYIKPMSIPKRLNKFGRKSKEYTAWEKSSDGQKVLTNLKEMAEYGKHGMKYPFVESVKHTDGFTYNYLLIKNGEGKEILKTEKKGQRHEIYRAYLISRKKGKETPTRLKQTGYSINIINEILPEGVYRAKSHKKSDVLTGKIKDGSPVTYGYNDWQAFERLSRQPNKKLMIPTWEIVKDMRVLLNQVLVKLQGEIAEHENQWKIEIDNQKKIFGEESIETILEELKKISGLGVSLWVDEKQNVHTPGSFMGGIKQNYFPVKFLDESVWAALRKEIKELDKTLEIDERDFEKAKPGLEKNELGIKIGKMKEKIKSIQDVYDESLGKSFRDPKQLMTSRSVYSKHRSTIMPYDEMRTDMGAIDEYINHSFRAVEINKLKLGLIKALSTMPKTEVFKVVKGNKSFEIFIENKKIISAPKALNKLIGDLKGKSLSTARNRIKKIGGTINKDREDTVMHDFLINRTKISLSDPRTEARFSSQKVANFLNKTPFIKGKRNWTPESVKETVVAINSYAASFFLNWSTALVNNTQRFNLIATFGLEMERRAARLLNEKSLERPAWEERAAYWGVTNIVNVFNEILLGGVGDETDIKDLLFAPLGPYGIPKSPIKMPIPWSGTFDVIELTVIGRKKFIKKGGVSVADRVIGHILDRREQANNTISKKKAKGKRLNAMERSLSKLESKALGKERAVLIQQMRRAYYRIVTGELRDAEDAKREFQILLGKARKDVVKRGVSAAMGWFPIEGIKKYLTMKESERRMRTQAGIVNLLIAEELGFLPEDEDTESGDKFKTEQAKFIARAGVYSSMFGMSQAMLPSAWQGAGQAFLQFKSYPYYQFIHDNRKIIDYVSSLEGRNPAEKTFDFVKRFGYQSWRAARYVPAAVGNFVFKGKSVPKKDYKLDWLKEDQTARAFTTIMYSRVLSPFIAAFIWEIPLLHYGTKMFGGRMLRGMENPVYGILIRLLLYAGKAAFIGLAEDDEDRVLKDWQRFMLPPAASYILEALLRQRERDSLLRKVSNKLQ